MPWWYWFGLGPPIVGDFVGHGAGEFGAEEQAGAAADQHPFHGLGPDHLVPGVVEFHDWQEPAVEAEHLRRPGAGRVDAGFDPFGIGEAAGANVHRRIGGHAGFSVQRAAICSGPRWMPITLP